MKKYLFLFSLTIFFANSEAQTSVYHPFPEDTATWITEEYSNICSGYCSSAYYEMNGDTIINGQSYNRIYARGGSFYTGIFSTCQYRGAIRQDSIQKKVYFIDSTMTTDTLLYDFNLAVGDTIHFNRGSTGFPLVVSGIDSVLINGSYQKAFKFTNLVAPSLIEGVGWNGDLLYGIIFLAEVANSLACFNGQPLHGTAVQNECSFPLACDFSAGVGKENEKEHFSLFPNPFSDKLNITISNQEYAEIILYDIASRKLLQQKFTKTISLNTSQLASGLYFYEVRNENGVVAKGKVVKE